MAETTAPPPPVPVRERGYMNDGTSPGGWGWDDLTRETTPELAWPLSVEVFHRMEGTDPQASSVMRAVTAPISRTQSRIDGNGCRDEVVEHVARNFALPVKGSGDDEVPGDNVPLRGADRFSWADHQSDSLLMLKYGHSFCEQLYWFDDRGRAHIRKLALRPARTLRRVNVARDGGLDSIEQMPAGNRYGVTPWNVAGATIPVRRLVAYVNEREGANWLGKSLLRSSYKNWILKDRDLRTMSMSNHRNGMGVPTYTGAEQETDLAPGKAIATQVRAGDDSGAAIPYGAKLELQGVTGRLPDILASIKYHDEQIARGVLAHFLNLGTQTGSWALGSTFANFFTLSLGVITQSIETIANRHVITDLVAANWGPDEPVPQLKYDEIGARESELDRLRQLSGLTDDTTLAAWIRKQITGSAQEEA